MENDYAQQLADCFKESELKKNVNLEFMRKNSKEKKVELLQAAGYSIEKICSLTRDEAEWMEEIHSGKKDKFSQYIYAFHDKGMIEQIEEREQVLRAKYDILRSAFMQFSQGETERVILKNKKKKLFIKDFSNMEKEDALSLVKSIVAADERRKYEPEKQFNYKLCVFKLSALDYLLFLSIVDSVDLPVKGSEIMSFLLNLSEQKETNLRNEQKETYLQSKLYWKKIANDFLQTAYQRYANHETDEKRNTYSFILDKALQRKLQLFYEKYHLDIKSVMLSAWGFISWQKEKRNKIIFSISQDGTISHRFPLFITKNEKIDEIIQSVNKQIKNMNQYNCCTMKDIEMLTEFEEDSMVHMLHKFLTYNQIDCCLTGQHEDEILSFGEKESCKANILVTYNLYGQDISMQYGVKSMSEEEVYRLHQTFLMVMESIMKLNSIIDIPEAQREYVESQSKLYKETKIAKCALCLKQSGIFDSLTKEELLEFSDHVNLYNALQSDSIYEEEEVMDHFVLIGDGKVEVSKADRDGLVKTVQLLGKRSIIGLDYYLESRKSKMSYSVCSENAWLVSIKAEDMRECIQLHPEILQNMVSYQTKQLHKFQSLWLLN